MDVTVVVNWLNHHSRHNSPQVCLEEVVELRSEDLYYLVTLLSCSSSGGGGYSAVEEVSTLLKT